MQEDVMKPPKGTNPNSQGPSKQSSTDDIVNFFGDFGKKVSTKKTSHKKGEAPVSEAMEHKPVKKGTTKKHNLQTKVSDEKGP
jgi:hypothetical protein